MEPIHYFIHLIKMILGIKSNYYVRHFKHRNLISKIPFNLNKDPDELTSRNSEEETQTKYPFPPNTIK
jgi:hypothetical protein